MKAVAKSVAAGLGLAALVCGFGAQAASHREAPMITQYPKVDNTDTYVFRSYEAGREGYVVFIANYIPLQDAYGGPNYFQIDPDAVYEVHIDNNGDAREDLTFSFRFTNSVRGTSLNIGGKDVAIPLVDSGQITTGGVGALNVVQSFTVDLLRGASRTATREPVLPLVGGIAYEKPIDNIGNKSIPDYPGYSAMHIRGMNIPGCTPPAGTFPRVFVGQRKEGFGVNLGEIFDLVNIPTARVIGSRSGAGNATQYKNVTSIAFEVPISCITTASDPVIGVWATASLPARKLNLPDTANANGYVQVSRLGMPLVNELVIGLPDKDKFNMSEPKDDGQFANYVTNPTLPALIASLYASAGVQAPSVFPRSDLVAVFLTGVPSVNQAKTVTASEMIRLNTALPADAQGLAEQPRRRGVLRRRRAGAEQSGVRSRGIPERTSPWRRYRRHRSACGDGLPAGAGRGQAVERDAAVYRRRAGRVEPVRRRLPVPASSPAGIAQRPQRHSRQPVSGRDRGAMKPLSCTTAFPRRARRRLPASQQRTPDRIMVRRCFASPQVPGGPCKRIAQH